LATIILATIMRHALRFLVLASLAQWLTSSSFAQITNFCPAQPNSTGAPAILAGSFGSGIGSGLHLEVSGGVPNEFGYFLVGDEATPAVAMGNGLLCLNGTATSHLYRYNVALGSDSFSVGRFDSAGMLQNLSNTSSTGTGFDVPATIPNFLPIAITMGSTWHFQCWYRDTVAAPGISNFSNGISVTFLPPGTPIAGMVAIPAGTFAMGSNAAAGVPYFGDAVTQPVHSVTILNSFWMGQHEVTQAEYLALMGTNPSNWIGNLAYPVETVNWGEARAYCAALTVQQMALGNVPAGYEYRLPTSAEWEYACRAGTTTEFSTGPELLCSEASFYYSFHTLSNCNNPTATVPVESYAPNAWGLYDMHGNVWEWCLDSFAAYSAAAEIDPLVTGGANRTLRGGSWDLESNWCRSAYRITADPVLRDPYSGFRVVLAPIRIP